MCLRACVHACVREWMSSWVSERIRVTHDHIWASAYHVIRPCACGGTRCVAHVPRRTFQMNVSKRACEMHVPTVQKTDHVIVSERDYFVVNGHENSVEKRSAEQMLSHFLNIPAPLGLVAFLLLFLLDVGVYELQRVRSDSRYPQGRNVPLQKLSSQLTQQTNGVGTFQNPLEKFFVSASLTFFPARRASRICRHTAVERSCKPWVFTLTVWHN